MKPDMEELREFKKELNKVSPTFCVAKWKQVTMHLESGLTHSCHHPKAHIVPLDELQRNPSALHNTIYKKMMRKQMLDGVEVKECEYCNRIERNKTRSLSDRIYKSHEDWALEHIPEITNNPWDYDVFPSYFEVSFSSACNCTCIYCSPTFSSAWCKEIEKYGPYDVSVSGRGFHEAAPPEYMGKPYNPYIEAFWKWWPELHKNLGWFRITGGEPLLSKDTFKILDYMIEKPRQKLHVSINSNLCISQKLFDNFIEKYKKIAKNQNVGLFTSCEAHGERAEYIRPGLKYDEWLENCRNYLSEVPNGRLTFMCTYNILSISSFERFLYDVTSLKREFPERVTIDTPFLMNPPYLQANIITKNFLNYVRNSITFMYQNINVKHWPPLSSNGFWEFEISKLMRIYNMIGGKPENKGLVVMRNDFAKFIDQHDKRYGSKFTEVFPEYTDFYKFAKEAKFE